MPDGFSSEYFFGIISERIIGECYKRTKKNLKKKQWKKSLIKIYEKIFENFEEILEEIRSGYWEGILSRSAVETTEGDP